MILEREELNNINGGSLSASYINAIVRGASFLYDLGRSIGSTARQYATRSRCK